MKQVYKIYDTIQKKYISFGWKRKHLYLQRVAAVKCILGQNHLEVHCFDLTLMEIIKNEQTAD